MNAAVDLDAFFGVLADLLDYSCVEEAEYQGQRRWVEQMLADADLATPALKKHSDDQLRRLRQLARNIGNALDALDAIDPALSGLLAAQSGDLARFREHAARLKAAALPPDSLAVHCAKLPRKRWPSQGGIDWPARILALTVGRLYIDKLNRRPTFGRDPDDPNKPSTKYGMFVEEAFAAGGVAARWDAATEWAAREGMTGLGK